MTSRLVVGCGSLARRIVSSLAGRPGDLRVVAPDESAVRTLREKGVAAETGDVADDAALASGAGVDPDTVVVATDDPDRNEAATGAARRAFPDAFVLAYTGPDPPPGTFERLADVADDVIDPGRVAVDHLRERIGDDGIRLRKLMAVLRDVDGTLAVVTHDNPDPDAIASAVALERIAASAGCEVEICYFGDISHQENRAFVNLLSFDLTNLDEFDPDAYGGVALVDHSRPGVNDGLPEDTEVDVVIDHHPPRLPVDARFVDLRSDVGATSTLLVDYLRRLGVTPDEAVATGLLFGIHVDTDEFTREVSADDFGAAAYLQPHADMGTLERIESPSVSADTLETIARAIRNRERRGPVLVSGVGKLADRDALAQAADRLLDLDDVTTTFVYGIAEGTVYVSARARGTDVDLGETLRDAFGQIGSAGGHADMAGAQISLGLLDTIEADDESLADVVSEIVTDRFLDAVESRTHRVVTDTPSSAFFGPGPADDTDFVSELLSEQDPDGGASAGEDSGTGASTGEDSGTGASTGEDSGESGRSSEAGDEPRGDDDGEG
ncbi:MAG: DHH family phosphoesterase [Haloarculaceae archaeon]